MSRPAPVQFAECKADLSGEMALCIEKLLAGHDMNLPVREHRRSIGLLYRVKKGEHLL